MLRAKELVALPQITVAQDGTSLARCSFTLASSMEIGLFTFNLDLASISLHLNHKTDACETNATLLYSKLFSFVGIDYVKKPKSLAAEFGYGLEVTFSLSCY